MNDILQWLYVFVAAYLLGAVYSLFVRRASHATSWKGAIKASNSGSVLYVLGAVVIISYTGNPWLLIPATIGDWLGTFSQIMYDIGKENGTKKFSVYRKKIEEAARRTFKK